ncbi:MAG TPA: ADP-glyceromanno-heptose 6-epimerase [Bacteroidia bacterium]|jgi:ADP-L-glycero-D-manno-heptose 6-epimerase|nr:ADP-glyceromanno-heptose 6-epimerase [Bacteroidia bacterium]HQK97566.1 ADP-glyceromanno-heptose 6-epimerase [Bacteroidia bacterium]
MIVVTGAAGFIGSVLTGRLNKLGFNDLLLVDDFSSQTKQKNLADKKYGRQIDREAFLPWFEANADKVSFVFHIGARTDTTEFNKEIFDKLNVNYTKAIWRVCTSFNIPLVYASSAATYGDGELGYKDDESKIPDLKPLNPYGWSKQEFDIWALEQDATPPQWQGLKFFNVYGPNEFHKARMASVIFHSFNQINATGKVKLFRSHRPDYKDGWQLRDFVYVMDVVNVCVFLMQHKVTSGIYNLGAGKARSFYDLAAATFNAMNKDTNIEFVDIPEDIRDKYQYFTEADMSKLIAQGYNTPFHSLEEGVTDYVKNYLMTGNYY